MAQRLIGVDIGTSAVRAAEVSVRNGEVILHRFGQVGLPPGAVEAGEIVEVDEVAAALKRLWNEVGFSHRRVAMGVGSPRCFLRSHELPSMPADEMRKALSFEVADLFPMGEEVSYDFNVIAERSDDAGNAKAELLVVATHPETLRRLIAVARKARLIPVVIDMVGLALLRALATPISPEGPQLCEAVVSVGAQVSVVAIHHAGVPRFVRISPQGGESLTRDLAKAWDVSLQKAEAVKRAQLLVADGDSEDPGRVAVLQRVSALAEEIANTIHFGTRGLPPLDRVVVTGGGSRSPGFFDALESMLSMGVQAGRLTRRIKLDHNCRLSQEDIRRAEPLMAAAIGLALAQAQGQFKPVNLLPSTFVEQRTAKAEALAVGALLVVVAGGLLWIWHRQGTTLSQEESQLATDQATIASLQVEVSKLEVLARDVEAVIQKEQLASQALSVDVDWAKVLIDIAHDMPPDVWLTSFSATAPSSTSAGAVNMSGVGFTHNDTAAFIIDEGKCPLLRGLFVSSSNLNPSQHLTTFSATAYLTPEAQMNRLALFVNGKATAK
jgi:type IV pilus assembly protein PilM